MKFLLIYLCVSIVLAEDAELMKEFAAGNNQFAAAIYKEMINLEDGNFLVCPLSAEIVLALMHAGSNGQTAKQLSDGLHLPKSKLKIQQMMWVLTPHLMGNDNYTLSSANKVYVKEEFKIKDQFRSIATEVFKAEIQTINFNNKKEAAAEMNKWVEEKTHHKIKNIIDPEILSSSTRSMLVNAMYFHGKWKNPFNINLTSKEPFYLPNEGETLVDMMKHTGYFKYYNDHDMRAQFLELPYAGDDITMTIALPFDKNSLPGLEARIVDILGVSIDQGGEILVKMPKFTFETTIKFTKILTALGIVEAFTDQANFNDILVNEPLKIDDVIQKTFIEVDEEGTIAAAATAAVHHLALFSKPPTPPKLIVDHPFIFYLKVKDVIFFLGRYSSPQG